MCDLLQSVFEIEECRQKSLMVYVGSKWRHFKNNLKRYYLAKDLTEHPSESYAHFIDQDVWDRFVSYHTTEELKV